MDEPFLPPSAALGPGVPIGPELGRGAAAFLTVAALLVGATVAQVAGAGPILMQGRANFPPEIYAAFRGWVAFTGAVAACGIAGVYRALRRGSVATPALLAFLLGYSLAFRMGNASFGWPFQVHVGMVAGSFGVGLNLVGVALVAWWFRARRRAIAPGPATGRGGPDPSGLAAPADGSELPMSSPAPAGAEPAISGA